MDELEERRKIKEKIAGWTALNFCARRFDLCPPVF